MLELEPCYGITHIDQAMSSYIARHRLGRKDDDTPVTQDAEVKKEMDKVFQEFIVLSWIDPATMMLKSNEQFFKTLTSG